MRVQWRFLSSDNYREKLLERTAPGEIVELVEFNYVKTTESLDEGLEAFDDLPKLTPELESSVFWLASNGPREQTQQNSGLPSVGFH